MNYRQQQIRMIAEIDQCLSLMREKWLDATTQEEKARSMARIDAMLDQRIIMMRNRDREVNDISKRNKRV